MNRAGRSELPAQLLVQNREVAGKIERGEPVPAIGVSRNYPDAKTRVGEDRIKPTAV